MFAAFDLGEFLRVFVRGSKILLPSRVCCLWTWGASLGQWQKQLKSISGGNVVALGSCGFWTAQFKSKYQQFVLANLGTLV